MESCSESDCSHSTHGGDAVEVRSWSICLFIHKILGDWSVPPVGIVLTHAVRVDSYLYGPQDDTLRLSTARKPGLSTREGCGPKSSTVQAAHMPQVK